MYRLKKMKKKKKMEKKEKKKMMMMMQLITNMNMKKIFLYVKKWRRRTKNVRSMEKSRLELTG